MFKRAKKKDYAPGLPDKKHMGNPLSVKPGQMLDFLIQRHEAERAGLHADVRIGDSSLGLFSWATKKSLPGAGQRIALFQQPLHRYEYKDFEGVIPEGYGKGKVTKQEEGKVLITKVSPESVHFTMAHKRHPQRFVLVKPRDPQDKRWLLVNTTPTKTIPYEKIKYTNIHHDKAEGILSKLQPGTSVQEKIDGAASLTQLMDDRLEVLSYRVSKETKGPIAHTERIFQGPANAKIPKHLKGSILRGEIYGVDSKGKAIPPQTLGGLLNSSVAKSISSQQASNTSLKNMVFDIEQIGTKPISKDVPYSERLALLKEVLQHLPSDKFHLPETADTQEAAKKLYKAIASGKNPRTKEGIVIHPPSGKPIKIKLTDEHEVHVTRIFPGGGKYEGNGAGGFYYSLTPGGEEVGKVGTGLSDQLRRDMAKDPDAYIGRVARIRAQDQHKSGAFRAPSLLAFHEDYPLVKAASKFWKAFKSLKGQKLKDTTSRLLGTAKATYLTPTRDLSEGLTKAYKTGENSDKLLKGLRWRLKTKFDNFNSGLLEPRSASKKEHIEFAKTVEQRIKSPTIKLVHEGPEESLTMLSKYGPNSGLDNPAVGTSGRLENVGAYFHEVGSSVEKSRKGAYATTRAKQRGGTPARLELEIPKDLLTKNKNNTYEPVVPKSLWKYTRNHKITKL
jgi:hypothetical protein